MNKKELLSKLKDFIKDISFQQVKLIKADFEANKNLSGIYKGGMINRQFAFNLIQTYIGKTFDDKGNEMPIAAGSYVFDLTDKFTGGEEVRKLEDSVSPKELEIKYKLNYELILFLNSKNILINESEDDKKKVLLTFYEQSGKIVVFPYIRHMMDILSREAGFLTPSLPPIIFKN
jgi:hypothetical protein